MKRLSLLLIAFTTLTGSGFGKIDFVPRVFVIGEIHHSESSQYMQSYLAKLACMGKIILGSEGISSGRVTDKLMIKSACGNLKKNAFFYGLESEHTQSLTMAFSTALYMNGHRENQEQLYIQKSNFIMHSAKNKAEYDSWKKVLKKGKEKYPRFTKKIDRVFMARHENPEVFERRLYRVLSDDEFISGNTEAFIHISRLYALQLMNDIRHDVGLSQEDLDVLKFAFNSPKSGDKEMINRMVKILTKSRDEIMGENLVKLYQEAKEKRRNLITFMGKNHIARVSAIAREGIVDSKVNVLDAESVATLILLDKDAADELFTEGGDFVFKDM